ncbi:hypothetical protein ABZW49_47715 [Nonomuraea wenchangensis]
MSYRSLTERGRCSRSSSENREPSGVFSVATRSPGSAGSARQAAPATVACSRLSATFRTSDTCRASTETLRPGSAVRSPAPGLRSPTA